MTIADADGRSTGCAGFALAPISLARNLATTLMTSDRPIPKEEPQ